MFDDDESEKRDPEKTLAWWVRYAFVPIAVALIAGISAVRAAELLSPDPAGAPPTATAPAPAAAASMENSPPAQSPAVAGENVPTLAITPTFTFTLPAPPGSTAAPTDTPVPTPAPPSDLIGFHVVRPGEYLYCIGRAYGVRPESIARANGLGRAALLFAGQVLAIPSARWRPIPAGPACARQFASPFPLDAQVVSIPGQVEPPQLAWPTRQPPTDTPRPAGTATPPAAGDTPTSPPPEPVTDTALPPTPSQEAAPQDTLAPVEATPTVEAIPAVEATPSVETVTPPPIGLQTPAPAPTGVLPVPAP